MRRPLRPAALRRSDNVARRVSLAAPARLSGVVRLLAACTRGAAAVEFAIISVVLIMLLIGIVDFGRTLYIKNQISFLADRAVRSVMLHPDIDGAALAAELRDGFTAGNPDSLAVDVTSQSVDGTDYRIVTIGFPVALFVPNIGTDPISLSVSRRVPAG